MEKSSYRNTARAAKSANAQLQLVQFKKPGLGWGILAEPTLIASVSYRSYMQIEGH